MGWIDEIAMVYRIDEPRTASSCGCLSLAGSCVRFLEPDRVLLLLSARLHDVAARCLGVAPLLIYKVKSLDPEIPKHLRSASTPTQRLCGGVKIREPDGSRQENHTPSLFALRAMLVIRRSIFSVSRCRTK